MSETRKRIHVAAAIIERPVGEGVAGVPDDESGNLSAAPGAPVVPAAPGVPHPTTEPSTCKSAMPPACEAVGPSACEILATQRGYGAWKDWWEFPGGKLEPGETSEQACRRELREELGVELADVAPFMTVEYDYPEFHLTMDCLTCRLAPGARLDMREHEAMRWLAPARLREVRWLPADEEVIAALEQRAGV